MDLYQVYGIPTKDAFLDPEKVGSKVNTLCQSRYSERFPFLVLMSSAPSKSLGKEGVFQGIMHEIRKFYKNNSFISFVSNNFVSVQQHFYHVTENFYIYNSETFVMLPSCNASQN